MRDILIITCTAGALNRASAHAGTACASPEGFLMCLSSCFNHKKDFSMDISPLFLWPWPLWRFAQEIQNLSQD